MVKAIPMEDWLRGCVYHDGRHGEVMLPTDKVLQIANYIQRTRRSVSDGLIDLKVEQTADTPQTETKGVRYCNECKWFRDKQVCGRCRSKNLFAEADTPQTDCGWK